MTKNLSKTGHRTGGGGGHPKSEKKPQQTSNATNHSQNETAANTSVVQKASIDKTMVGVRRVCLPFPVAAPLIRRSLSLSASSPPAYTRTEETGQFNE